MDRVVHVLVVRSSFSPAIDDDLVVAADGETIRSDDTEAEELLYCCFYGEGFRCGDVSRLRGVIDPFRREGEVSRPAVVDDHSETSGLGIGKDCDW